MSDTIIIKMVDDDNQCKKVILCISHICLGVC